MSAAEFRLVLDTDVVLSGLRSSGGASRILLIGLEVGVIRLLLSSSILFQYEAVLKRDQHLSASGSTTDDIDRFLNRVSTQADHVKLYFSLRPLVRDPNDDLFAEAAESARADALVTFNVGDYRPTDPAGRRLTVPVLRPGEILRRLQWRPAASTSFSYRLP